MPIKDPETRRTYYRAYYAKKKAENGEFMEKRRTRHRGYLDRNKQIIDEFREAGCIYCNEKETCCLQAHHRDPNEKEFMIAKAASERMSEKRLRAELDKCDCVCANCHFKIHAGSKVVMS